MGKSQKSNYVVINTENILSIKSNRHILYEAPYYLDKSKHELGVSQYFYVILKKSEDIKQLEELAEFNNVIIEGNNKYMPLIYILSCSKKSQGNALEMANIFYETDLFQTTEPDFLTKISTYCVEDTFFSDYQWNLNNTGQEIYNNHHGLAGIDINICDAWQRTTGNNNIIIAVLDNGFQLDHPDLKNVSPVSYDTETGTSPSQIYHRHGTVVAGVIGASHNNNGIAGISPKCQLMSISNQIMDNDSPTTFSNQIALGFGFAINNNVSVIVNAWGIENQSSVIDYAINNALTQGRDGLGCVVVFATGNDGDGPGSFQANSVSLPSPWSMP